MRKTFTGLTMALMLAVVVQIFLAGAGAFDTGPNDEAFQPHRVLGYAIVLIAVLLTLLAALARMPGRLIGMAGLVAGLALLQPVIRAIASAFDETGSSGTLGELIFGLHAVNGLVILAVVGTVNRQARESSKPRAAARSAINIGDDGSTPGSTTGIAEPTS
jgi:hypothetical protein